MKTPVKIFKMNSVSNSKFSLLFIIPLCIILCFSSCSEQKHITAKLQRAEYNQPENIPDTEYQYNSESKTFYLITNDSNNLYIYLKAIQETAQKKILMFGFTVWIDTTARNKKHMGIRYPLARNEQQHSMSNRFNRSGKANDNFQESSTEIIKQLNKIELTGFDGGESSMYIPAINTNDIRGRIKFGDNGDLLYKLTIPKERIGVDTIKNETLLSLNMESGYPEISKPSGRGGKSGGSGMGGSRPGGAVGRQGAGMGRNPQAMQRGKQELSKPIKIKLIIKLSDNEDIR